MKINYHIHTAFSGDMIHMNRSEETPDKYASIAVGKKFDEICFTDHLVIGYPRTMPLYVHSMDPDRLNEYFKDVADAARNHPQIVLRTGIEIDWLPEKLDDIRKALGKHPFDCVLGSVHQVGGMSVEHEGDDIKNFWEGMSDKEVYERYAAYYRALQEMVKSRMCDVVSHLDLVKRDGVAPKKSTLPLIKDILDAITENDLCIEVNTSGMRKPAKEMHPTTEVLRLCRKMGIPVTIGTDAHKSERIDDYHNEGMKMIREAGYTELAVFEKRKRDFVNI